jgi:hypothetical protein
MSNLGERISRYFGRRAGSTGATIVQVRDPSELYDVIGQGLLDAAPAVWVEAGAIWRSVGKYGQGSFFAILEDGEKETINVEHEVLRALDELRNLFAQPGTGAWFTATAGFDREGRITFDFDYDSEPQFTHSISVGHYLEEWEKFPRDEAHTPAWLAERLVQAREREKTPE